MIDLSADPLPDAEVRDLVRQHRAGDPDAAGKIIRHNDRLVYRLAMRYYKHSGDNELDDLMQWGRLGILRALRDYDPSRENFSTYSYYWVRLYISRYGSRQGRAVTMSYKAGERLATVMRHRSRLTQSLGREPSRAELAAATRVSEEQIGKLNPYAFQSVDNDRFGPEGNPELEYMADPDANVEDAADERLDLAYAHRAAAYVATLPESWQRVIVARCGLDGEPPRSLRQIADEIGVSPERVRQIELAALMRIRQAIS